MNAKNTQRKLDSENIVYINNVSFNARVRYLTTSLIITIPAKCARELDLKIGDTVKIKLEKENSNPR